ncbi:hypothetical protein RUM8411_04230 [Ruegeria meonggei]|uniref:Uncharacterized protein n=1 Tax=Ruegeria meonggei TaxID=1446476 RepID=A0A1X7ABW5_9RHOB|nr:hypothetical protein RUM8411_04230 [Ruegeria meonggei]
MLQQLLFTFAETQIEENVQPHCVSNELRRKSAMIAAD